MKSKQTLAVAFSIALGTLSAFAGGNLNSIKCVKAAAIPSDGQYYELDWPSATSPFPAGCSTIYIVKMKAYVQGGNANGGDINGYVDIEPQGNESLAIETLYWTWQLSAGDSPFGIGAKGNQVEDDWSGSYFTFHQGDTLACYQKATGFNGRPTLMGVHIWYTTTQP